jgi:CheY-like chemotaxis protein
MPDLDGLEATRQIATDPELVEVRVVILTTFALDEYLFDAHSVVATIDAGDVGCPALSP